MPQILVVAEQQDEAGNEVVYRERLSCADFESDYFTSQLAERVGWAVTDADRLEQRGRRPAGASAGARRSAPRPT
jgi:hypothetical protein